MHDIRLDNVVPGAYMLHRSVSSEDCQTSVPAGQCIFQNVLIALAIESLNPPDTEDMVHTFFQSVQS